MSTPTNPRPSAGPNGAPPMKMRRPKAADPLVRPKRKPAPKPGGAPSAGNGTTSKPAPSARPPSSTPQPRPHAEKAIPTPDNLAVNGFSAPLITGNYVDCPLVTTKRALREGLKHHVARFASKKSVDPRDEEQFTRPVRLQRRDPRAKSQEMHEAKDQVMMNPASDSGQPMDEAEREDFEARRAARDKERAENLAQIAPAVGSGSKRTNLPKQRTQQVSKTDMTPEEVARTKIKYEEALPWHVEDFDNKNVWVGNYEAALSETHAAFVHENTGKMRMIPVEKWYKFTAKSQFKPLSIEEAEKYMAKKVKDPRWFMEKQQEFAEQKQLESFAKSRRAFAGKQGTPTGDGLEADELDFEEDRFADDEEHDDLFNDDEDAKVAEKRIKQDQLKANVFDLKEEKEYEHEEQKEKKEKEAQRVLGKKVRKALQKREKNFDYSSGSDVNPYSDESSDESEDEEQKDEEKKAEEEKNRKESGTSSRDHGTPSGRQKHTDPLKKGAARKRPGSPNVSDASGTDTSRKKAKSKHPSSQPTPQPNSRPMSPAPSSMQPGKKRVRNVRPGAAGSGSDVDAAGSAGEMSESGKTKKLKLNPPGMRSPSGTPQGSRAGSPTPLSARGYSGSRASSPEQSAGGLPPGQINFPTPAEIHASIPANGILSSDLLRIFRPRIGDSRENHRRFIAIVKDVGVYGKEDRLLRPGPLKES